MSDLYQNCRNFAKWPRAICAIGNICGFCSTALWFLVLVPQVAKNFRLRSVVGLSFLWAAANFTASLINLFFVFSSNLPLYLKVQGVYQPCLEFTILFQFMLFSKKLVHKRLLAFLVCLLLWSAVIETELTVDGAARNAFWGAVFLWSVETFPQVVLNMNRRSTSGQSAVSVGIALIGKVTDFVASYSLAMPLPIVVMAYFSSSLAYVNGFQIFWYGLKKAKKQETSTKMEIKALVTYVCQRCPKTESKLSTPNAMDESESLIETVESVGINPTEEVLEGTLDEVHEDRKEEQQPEPDEQPNLPLTRWRIVGLVYCSLMLLGFACGLVSNVGAWWAICGPVLLLLAVLLAYLHRNYKEGKLPHWLSTRLPCQK